MIKILPNEFGHICGTNSAVPPVESCTLCVFARMVDEHDLTFTYSDDHSVWVRGNEEYRRIKVMAEALPETEAVRIWNDAVDRKLLPGVREEHYWIRS